MISVIRLSLTVCAAYLLIACSSSGSGKFAKAYASPDQAYIAIVVTEVGSEFPGSSCTDTVVVVPRGVVASGNYPASSRAYVGGCHSLKMTYVNGQRSLPNAPQLRWTNLHSLQIVFEPELARKGSVPFYSVTSLYDGLITIHTEAM